MTDALTQAQQLRLPGQLRNVVDAALERAVVQRWATRLWARDPLLWTSDDAVAADIANRLGWLDAAHHFRAQVEQLMAFADGAVGEGFEASVVCGMGGSSLAPEVLARSLARGRRGLPVHVLDSTDPAAVRTAQQVADPARTLYLIASKSGTTTETLAFLAHFWQVADDLHADIPASRAAEHFVAISDPGDSVEALPHSDLFRSVFLNPPDVGGRYSALTYVGLVPAALMDLDLPALLDDALLMSERCRDETAANPGLWLGVALGALAIAGRDKLTFVIEPRLAAFAAWAEQLIAESTGKRGRGVVPVDGEPLGPPEAYGEDRLFVRLGATTDSAWRAESGRALDALAGAGQPIIDLTLADGDGLGGEFFRWQFATAVAGAVLDVNPFDEPNVAESKANTKRVLGDYEQHGALPADEPIARHGDLTVIGDAPLRLSGDHASLAGELRRHLERLRPSGYLAVQAYLAQTPPREALLRDIQRLLRDATRSAVTLGYGPRFLHSTGQLHKGGPPTGVFLQLTADHPADLPIPGRQQSFGTLIDAQALGDFQALEAHELPVARVHLGADPDAGLASLRDALADALGGPAA